MDNARNNGGYNVQITSENLSPSCLLENTEILVYVTDNNNEYKKIQNIKENEYIISENNNKCLIKKIHKTSYDMCKILDNNSNLLPYKIEKDYFNIDVPSSTLYVTLGHSINIKNLNHHQNFIVKNVQKKKLKNCW